MNMKNMTSVSLNFHAGVTPQQQESVFRQIKNWSHVIQAAPLVPGSDHPQMQRMGAVYVDDGADVQDTVKHLRDLPEIETAEVPAERELV